MYTVYEVVLEQNAPVVGKTIGAQIRGDNKCSVLFKGEQKISIAAYREQSFFGICFQFQEPRWR